MTCLFLNSLEQEPADKIMDLCGANQFYPLPLPCPAPSGTWKWSCRWHSGLAVREVYIVKIEFRSGFRILFCNYLGAVLAACVIFVLLLVHSYIIKGQKCVYFFTTKAAWVILSYYVSGSFTKVIFSSFLFSKSCYTFELCYNYLKYRRASTGGVQKCNKTLTFY